MTIHRTAMMLRIVQSLCFVVVACYWTPPIDSAPPVRGASHVGTPRPLIRTSASLVRSSETQAADDRPDVSRRSPMRRAVKTNRRTTETTTRTQVTGPNQYVPFSASQNSDHWNLSSRTVDGFVSMQSNAEYLLPVPMSDVPPVLSRAPINALRVAEAVR